MKTYIFLTITSVLFLLSSCFKDSTEFGTKKISEISLDEEWEEVYNADKWETFSLDPKISQAIEDKELKYEWQINYKVVSTEKVLTYPCKELGEYNCRYKAYNEDGAVFKQFTLKVNSPYEEGLLLLSESDGKSMLSFKRMDKDGYHFITSVYKTNNPNSDLGNEPTLLLNHRDYVYVGTANPTTLIRFNSKTFELSNILEYPGQRADGAVFAPTSEGITFLGDNRIYDYETKQNMFMNILMNDFPEDVKISDKSVMTTTGYAFFDNYEGRLFYYQNYSVSEILTGTFTGKKLVDILTCDENKNLLAIMKDPSNGAPYVVRYVVKEDVLEKNYNAQGTTIDLNGKFLTSSKLPLLYYSSGNKIYAYNYIANNFPTDAFITLDNSNAVIKSMLFDEEEEKLFVAANIGNEALNATVYCYDMETKEQVWKEENVAGNILDMIYKR